MSELPFTPRTVAAIAVFNCHSIAAPAGAQMLTMIPATIGALQLDYAQLFHIYRRLIHQDVANQKALLVTAVNDAVTAIAALNGTLQGMTATGDQAFVLAHFQIVVANALTNTKAAQTALA